MSRVAVLFLSLVLVGPLLACSGDGVRLDDYRKSVVDLFSAYDRDISTLTSTISTSGTEDEVFDSLSTYAAAGLDRTQKLLDDWTALRFPERAAAAHDEGRKLIEQYKSAFEGLKAGAAAHDLAARETFNNRIQTLPDDVAALQQALNSLS